MSTIKANAVTGATTNSDLTLTGDGTGVPDLGAGMKVGGSVGIPVSELRTGTDGELITWDASGNPATVAVGTSTHVLTSNGVGAAPTFQAAAGGGFTLGTEQDVTGAGPYTFSSIPAGTTMIVISLYGVSVSGTTSITIEIGDVGGIESSGYTGECQDVVTDATASNSSHFKLTDLSDPGSVYNGHVRLALEDSSGFTWVATSQIGNNGGGEAQMMHGVKSLSAELTQLRIANANGFDASGVVNIMYQ